MNILTVDILFGILFGILFDAREERLKLSVPAQHHVHDAGRQLLV